MSNRSRPASGHPSANYLIASGPLLLSSFQLPPEPLQRLLSLTPPIFPGDSPLLGRTVSKGLKLGLSSLLGL